MTSIYNANILHIQKEKRMKSKFDLFGTPRAGFSPREMAEVLYLTNH